MGGGGGGGEKSKGMKKHKFVVTKQSQEFRVRHRECSQYRCDGCVWCQADASGIGGSLRKLYTCLTSVPHTRDSYEIIEKNSDTTIHACGN